MPWNFFYFDERLKTYFGILFMFVRPRAGVSVERASFGIINVV